MAPAKNSADLSVAVLIAQSLSQPVSQSQSVIGYYDGADDVTLNWIERTGHPYFH